ncbi:Nuclear LIM interactor-interacting factor 1 [Giardia lamblia P15]|uniref:Mitochondrial import inner membrane translocase subunit TIM50 n=1 Tax=Giardia intestinalis (strain P15) TaxID=658858 RepID=E1F8A2_GIAIA|nr:Nuclear LIM interactor-interacting factor 1 [Giardia lamblia P15]
MSFRKPAKSRKTMKGQKPEVKGVIPITRFLINIDKLDSAPLYSPRTQRFVPIPSNLLNRHDFFLQSIRTSDAVETWANAFVTLQRMANSSANGGHIDQSDHVVLPPPNAHKKGRPTLVLDLDATLFYTSAELLNTPLDYFDIGEESAYRYLYLRPYALDFLAWASTVFEVIVWTAALESYAEPRIRITEIDRYADVVLYRSACDMINGSLVKNLAKLGRPLSDMIIVDDNPVSYALNVELAYPIPPFNGEEDDLELLRLVPILRKVLELSSLKRGIYKTIFSGSSMHRALETIGQYTYASGL